MRATPLSGALSIALLVACGEGKPAAPRGDTPGLDGKDGGATDGALDGASGDGGGASDPEADIRSVRPRLQWKRYAAFENDLAAALELPKDALCKELGAEDCVRGVHLSPLGGHDPFGAGLLESSAEPLATTPTVVERIVLAACARRAQLDKDAGAKAVVMRGIDLGGSAPDEAAAHALIDALYRRFLARTPEPAERSKLAALTRTAEGRPVSALAFAQAACFAIGTHSEFLFF